MEKLIEALQIFLKYGNPAFPTSCEHDTLFICGIDPEIVMDHDKLKLEELGFFVGGEYPDQFISFRYGSAKNPLPPPNDLPVVFIKYYHLYLNLM